MSLGDSNALALALSFRSVVFQEKRNHQIETVLLVIIRWCGSESKQGEKPHWVTLGSAPCTYPQARITVLDTSRLPSFFREWYLPTSSREKNSALDSDWSTGATGLKLGQSLRPGADSYTNNCWRILRAIGCRCSCHLKQGFAIFISDSTQLLVLWPFRVLERC